MSNHQDSFHSEIRRLLEEPMRWVGMYIAAASATCVLAMAADLFNGFRDRRFWFRCKYFSLNAFSLTLLAVSMKLPVDLTTEMLAPCDWLAKLASLTFMLTALANFLPSLGSMSDQDMLANVIALSIFLVTVVGNVFIQLFQLRRHIPARQYIIQRGIQLAAISILVLLGAFISLSIMVLTAKRLIDSMYKERHNVVLNEEESGDGNNFIRTSKIYWMMAETGSPQFVIARSVMCTAASAISLLSYFFFVVLLISIFIAHRSDIRGYFFVGSMYGWSTRWILGIQSIGVVVGSVAPAFRFFFSLRYQTFHIGYRSYHKNISGFFHIHRFWFQRLEEWRDRTFDHIQFGICIKCLDHIKCFILNLFIRLQILAVGISKFIVSIFVLPLIPFACIKKLIDKHFSLDHSSCEKSVSKPFTEYVLLLEGEEKFSERTLRRICGQAERLIQRGRRNQLENLFRLLRNMSCDFNGVREFDNIQIESLCSQEPPYFWALPLVTLASIATALPTIPKDKKKQLMRGVSEGLPLVKLVDMLTDTNKEFINIRRAADAAWIGVHVCSKWLGNDLKGMSLTDKDSKDVLKKLSKEGKTVVLEFKREAKKFLVANPVYWPFEVIAANAMYRICETVLKWDCSNNEALFERLTLTIADVMGACLTNLEHVIMKRCHQFAIEEREKNVHEALLMYGKTEKILQFLRKKKIPCIDPDEAIYVKEWRTRML